MKFEEEYAGKKISIDDGMNGHGHHPDHVSLSIDGIEVHVMKDRYGKYSSHFLPYQEFSTPLKLARALIDKVPYFKVKRSN